MGSKMLQTKPDKSFDELLSEVAGLHRYIGRPELRKLAQYFSLSAAEMHMIYLHRLLHGHALPLLVVSDALLEEIENADT